LPAWLGEGVNHALWVLDNTRARVCVCMSVRACVCVRCVLFGLAQILDLSSNCISKSNFEGLATMLENCERLAELNLACEC
jgi:hypothetical protein